MSTKRAFDTKDPLDTVIVMDSIFQLSLASGATSQTPWEERTELGRIDLFVTTTEPVEPEVDE